MLGSATHGCLSTPSWHRSGQPRLLQSDSKASYMTRDLVEGCIVQAEVVSAMPCMGQGWGLGEVVRVCNCFVWCGCGPSRVGGVTVVVSVMSVSSVKVPMG